MLGTAGRTPAGSPDHHQAHLLIEAARFYSQLTKWDDRFAGPPPYRVPHLVYAPFPFDAEVPHLAGHASSSTLPTRSSRRWRRCAVIESQFDEARFARIRHFVTGQTIAYGSRCGFAYGELFALPVTVGGPDLCQIVLGGKGSPAPGRRCRAQAE